MFAAAEAMEVVGVELQRRLLVGVERALRRVVVRERDAHQIEQRGDGVVEVGERSVLVLRRRVRAALGGMLSR